MIISSKDFKIQFFEEPEYVTKHSEKIENVINKFLAFFSVSKLEVDISFCTENEITKLNKEFRGKNNSTNVLSFPDKEQKNISNECFGELMICQKVLEKEAFDQEKKIFDFLFSSLISPYSSLITQQYLWLTAAVWRQPQVRRERSKTPCRSS